MHTEELRGAATRANEMVVRGWVRGRGPQRRPQSNYASKCAHPCVFHLYAARTKWDEAPDVDGDLIGIFKQGDDIEDGVITDMREAGFRVNYQQVLFEDKALQLRGRVDGFLSVPDDPLMDVETPFDVKSVHPSWFDTLTSFDSMFRSDKPWLRMYPGQSLMYATMPGGRPYTTRSKDPSPYTSIILRNKANRQTRFIIEEVAHWQHEIDRIGSTLRSVNWHVSRKKDPKPMKYDPTFCDWCDYAAVCPTMQKFKTDAEVLEIQSPELDSLVQLMIQRKPQQLEYDRSHRKLKKILEDRGMWEGKVGKVRTLITDHHRVECKVTKRTVREGEDLRPELETTGKGLEYASIDVPDGG